ncbi:zona pellucida protein AX 2 [Sinocyclocheilus grahami]|uniref:zona pellucida protein AX 2 n=1 Tax=Sinocyclocheilus grahami TaxID=75366 RepID=UPI0007ACA7EE|nr:PREDICTED: uncharacterized protein LOC107549499 [Sinocyclocheilus grahami]
MECFEIGALWVMVTIICIHADTSEDGIQAECLGNRVQFILPGSLSAGNPLEVYAVNNTHTVLLSPHLAAQCGYKQKSDPWGNMIVSASLQSCFAENQGDKEFKVAVQFKLYEIPTLSEKVHEVFKSCSHTMISREILCETNFMEVSVRNALPEIKIEPVKEWPTVIPNLQLWKILLYTPGEKAFDKDALQAMGYSVYSSPTRLVMRSPFDMAENFIQNVDNVDMMVFKSVVLFRDRWVMTIVESAAACPINGASVVGQMIYWHVPLRITPLVSSEVEILEVHLGVNGRRFTPEEMGSHNYVMAITDSHIVVEIPIGAADGYYKSHVLNDQQLSVQLAGIMGRLDVEIYDSLNNWSIREFSLACPFFVKLSECFSNGTITVVLPKLESVPHLHPGELSLRDPACKPYDNEDYFAYFHFNVTSCGTTRKFVGDTMVYENEVTRKKAEPLSQTFENPEPEYRFMVSCVYIANATQSMNFETVSHFKEPYADVGKGELTISLRLSKDMVYRLFYHDGDYPVLKFLKQPLYFEVGMNHSSDSRLAVALENCWATLTEDKESKPRWDLIVDGCANPKDPEQTIIRPVVADERVNIPDHFKRFEVKTFTFTEDYESSNSENATLARRVFVHCDVIICHAKNTADGRCYKQCEAAQNLIGSSSSRVRRSTSFSDEALQHVSIGPILLM